MQADDSGHILFPNKDPEMIIDSDFPKQNMNQCPQGQPIMCGPEKRQTQEAGQEESRFDLLLL